PEAAAGEHQLPRVEVNEHQVYLARFTGSFFALRAAVEPLVSKDVPPLLLVYLPGAQRDPQGSLLMEIELAGILYQPQLKRLASHVLRQRFTDAQVDDMLRPSAAVSYEDVVDFLRQGEQSRSASMLRTLFSETRSEALIARWLVDDRLDEAIAEKDAIGELTQLIASRLGLEMPPDADLAMVRDKTLTYVLVGEFRSDLDAEPPSSVSMIATAPSSQHVTRIRETAEILRQGHAERYVELADRVEQDLLLGRAEIDPAHLGSIDTFRFEESRLLAHAGELITTRQYSGALSIVTGRSRSFWVDRDVSRQNQWEACRLMAELGLAVDQVARELASASAGSAGWVAGYTAEDGWQEIDRLQRHLLARVNTLDDEPENRQALALVRREHEETLRQLAEGFTVAFRESAWAIPGALHQTRVFSEMVAPKMRSGCVAYFLVDALRYEMGVELKRQLVGAEELAIKPAIAALPTVTSVGMAALLPGASASFSVVEHRGKLAAEIEGTKVATWAERLKWLRAKVPGVVELRLGELLELVPTRLAKKIADASLIVIRSQEIDFAGETDGALLARSVMDTVISNLARAVRKLAKAGVESFVITADHGHQFSLRKEEDMRTDSPGQRKVDLHRRCWTGHGGTTPPGAIRIPGAELGYHTDLDFVFPSGLGVFKAPGGLRYHHGGLSLQEVVVPVVTCRLRSMDNNVPTGKAVRLAGLPETISNRTFGIRILAEGDLFASEPMALRVVLLADGEQVGQAGMSPDAELDRATGILHLAPRGEASVGLMLGRDDIESVRVVIQDSDTDAVLAESEEIPVRLSI
ncbi:MAG: PglZ domain-containing protein, partial [Acidobacteriota bacterium]